MSSKYEIRDWTDKVCFDGRTFDSLEDAWAFIYEADPNTDEDEHYYDDYYVEAVGK